MDDKDICALFDMICDKENNCVSCQLYQSFCLDELNHWLIDKFKLNKEEVNLMDYNVKCKIRENYNEETF